MFSSAARCVIARIALAAMLFSAASPTLAAALFSHRADITSRILGLDALSPSAPSHDAAPHEHGMHHGHAGHEMADETNPALPADEEGSGSGHAAHGNYCSFCLAASSVVALTGGHCEAAPVIVDALPAPPFAEGPATSLLPLVLRVRGPPSISRS